MQQELLTYTKKTMINPANSSRDAERVNGFLTRFADQAPYFLGVGAG